MNETPTRSTGRKWNFDRPARNPNTMDVDAMTIEERSQLMKKGACFGCKEPGHIAKDCPKKKKKRNYEPRYSKKDPCTSLLATSLSSQRTQKDVKGMYKLCFPNIILTV